MTPGKMKIAINLLILVASVAYEVNRRRWEDRY